MGDDGAILCNTMRYPDLWYPIYNVVKSSGEDGIQEISEAIDVFGINEKICDEACVALLILGILKRDGKKYHLSETPKFLGSEDEYLSEMGFRVWATYNIRKQTSYDGKEWTRQSHFLLTYRYLIANNRTYVNRNDKKLARDINQYLAGNICHVGFNIQKLNHFNRIACYLGLSMSIPGGAVTALNPDVLWTALCNDSKVKKKAHIPFNKFLDLIDANLILIPQHHESGNRIVPDVLSYALRTLENERRIKMISGGDKDRVQLEGVPLSSRQSNVYTHVEVLL